MQRQNLYNKTNMQSRAQPHNGNTLLTGVCLSIIILLLLSIPDAFGEKIDWQVISCGGTDGSYDNNKLKATAGQTAIGRGYVSDFGLYSGFWGIYSGPPPLCDCEPGNANGDAVINIFDITYIIAYLYMGGPAPIPYELCNGDPNCDCTCNIFDVTYLISYLYLGGPPPCPCEKWLGSCREPLRSGE